MNLTYRHAACLLGVLALVVLGLGASSPPSTEPPAPKWVELGTHRDGQDAHYYDANSLRTDGNVVYFQFKTTFAKPKYMNSLGGYLASTVSYDAVNCSSRISAGLALYYYDPEGNVLTSYTTPPSEVKFTPITPHSPGSYEADAICGLGTR